MMERQSSAGPIPQQLRGTVLVSLMIGALTIVGWISVDQYFTIKKQQSQIQATVGLKRQVSELHSYYLEADPEGLPADLQQAENLLIHDFTHLAEWAQRLQEQSNQWNLDMHYRIVNSDRTASSIEGITLVPLEIQVQSQGTQSAYRRYLQFIKTLTRSGPKVEIRNMTVMGDGQKATHLTIGLSVWMKAKDSVEL